MILGNVAGSFFASVFTVRSGLLAIVRVSVESGAGRLYRSTGLSQPAINASTNLDGFYGRLSHNAGRLLRSVWAYKATFPFFLQDGGGI